MAKSIKPFFKDLTPQQVIALLDQEYPISLKHNEDLVNRVAMQYPMLKKAEIGKIIKGVFQSFRDLLILGKEINVLGLLHNARFQLFLHPYKQKQCPALRIKLNTPIDLRKHD